MWKTIHPSQKKRVRLSTFLDLGCTRCLISPTMVGRLGICLWKLKTLILFCQLDGPVMGREPAILVMEPLEIAREARNERLMFTVALGTKWPLVLGLIWLKQWNLRVDWKE